MRHRRAPAVVTHYSSRAVSRVFSGIHEEPKVTLPEVAQSLLERRQDFLEVP